MDHGMTSLIKRGYSPSLRMCRPLRSLSRDIDIPSDVGPLGVRFRRHGGVPTAALLIEGNGHTQSYFSPRCRSAVSACETCGARGALACGAGEIAHPFDDDWAVGGHVQGDVGVGRTGVDI